MANYPRYPSFALLMDQFIPGIRESAAGAPRLDGLERVETPYRPIAQFDYAGRTWGIDGDTRFEPLDIAHRAVTDDPSAQPFLVQETKTQLKLVLRAELDILRKDRGSRGASYLYIYAPRRVGDRPTAIAPAPEMKPDTAAVAEAVEEHAAPQPPSPGDTPIVKLINHISVLGPPDAWGAQTTYASVPVAAIDSVWSLGVKYQGVLNVIERLRGHARSHGVELASMTTSAFVDLVDETGGPEALVGHVANRQRTSARSGILKAEAIYREAVMLRDEGIELPVDVTGARPEVLRTLERRWRYEVPGQASGLSWEYFLMLLDLPGVKADRMVCRFVATALGQSEAAVSQGYAAELVYAAADALGVDARHLDFNIWNYQRGQG